MISSTSRRLPHKICGLFDTGLAGGVDVFATSSNPGGVQSVVLDQSVFSLEDLQPFGPNQQQQQANHPTTATVQSAAADSSHFVAKESGIVGSVPAVDWPADLLDPLGGLDDPLGDDSLDAFVNLDTFLLGDTFLDECEMPDQSTEENHQFLNTGPLVEEVKPVIEFRAEPITTPLPQTVTAPVAAKPCRKRKASKKSAAVKTSLFEIPAASTSSSPDHDYSSKQARLSPPEESVKSVQPATSCGPSTSKAAVTTEDKQTIRRIKNNVASKRSREQRKAKFAEMDQEADYLTEENERLRGKIAELEKIAKEMKALLVAKMAGKA